MHITALPHRLGQRLANRRLEPLVIVRDDELDAEEATRLEPGEKVAPARPALAVREIDAEHLAPAFPVDADRDQYRLMLNRPGLADPLVARIEDQIGIGLAQPALGKRRQRPVEPRRRIADRRGREAVAAQLLGDRLDPRLRGGRLLRVETPCTYISASAATSAFSDR
jgi:hypothetical protein